MLQLLTLTGLSPSMADLPKSFKFMHASNVVVLQPLSCRNRLRFGLLPVRSPLLRKSLLFSFPPLT